MTSEVAKLKVKGEYGSIYCDTIPEVQQLPVYTGSGPPLNLPWSLKHRHESKQLHEGLWSIAFEIMV